MALFRALAQQPFASLKTIASVTSTADTTDHTIRTSAHHSLMCRSNCRYLRADDWSRSCRRARRPSATCEGSSEAADADAILRVVAASAASAGIQSYLRCRRAAPCSVWCFLPLRHPSLRFTSLVAWGRRIMLDIGQALLPGTVRVGRRQACWCAGRMTRRTSKQY